MTLKTKLISIQLFGLLSITIVGYFDWPLETWFHYYLGRYITGAIFGSTIIADGDNLPTKWDMTSIDIWICTGIVPMLYAFIEKIHKKGWIVFLGLLPLFVWISIVILVWIIYFLKLN